MNGKDLIIENIELFSDALDIDIPAVVFSTDKNDYTTPTQRAGYDMNTETLYIRSEDFNPDMLHVICYELRHMWQMKNRPDMFDDYKQSDAIGVNEYNLQPAEVDANAYAVVAIEYCYKIRPTFNALGVEVCEAIEKRANEIRSECEAALAEVLDI